MRPTTTVTAAAVIIIAFGLAGFVYGVLGDGRVDLADLRALGLACVVCTLQWLLHARGRRSEDDVYEAGRQSGYDAGVLDERAAGTVVPLRLRAVGSSD